MNTLLYLSFGGQRYADEACFSILSAFRWMSPGAPLRIVVQTDTPTAFSGFPVVIEPLSLERLREWSGPHRYFPRAKLWALYKALRRHGDRCALIDTDTYFKRSPLRLFRRIAPGHSLMHEREGPLADFAPLLARFLSGEPRLTGARGSCPIPTDVPMWNSGVLGVDPADADLLLEAVHLNDLLYDATRVYTTEQFSAACALATRTRLHEASDLVEHYWSSIPRDSFHASVPEACRREAELPLHRRARAAYRRRPPARRRGLRWRVQRFARHLAGLLTIRQA